MCDINCKKTARKVMSMIVLHLRCKAKAYPLDLPKVSIIICYYNEATSALIRMINSILDRTPHALIHEIILVDDQSQLLQSVSDLQFYANKNWPGFVKLERTKKREGLIRAKVYGSHMASAEVLVFLDSHCEVQLQWLEPLLSRIAENSKRYQLKILTSSSIAPSPF